MSPKHLTAQDILNQTFKNSMRGYNAVEVDEFLDLILQDYEAYEKEVTILRQENARLMQHVNNIVKQPTAVETPQNNGTTNYDILKRLSNLEKHVFGSKLDI